MRGTVAAFDEEVGLGTIRGEDGRVLAFHCTRLTDGSRSAEVGALVCFDIVPGHLGRWEAARVEKL